MREYRKKQKILFNIMRAFVIFGAIYIVVFIGVQPYIAAASESADTVCRYVADITIIIVLALVFVYYSRYSKTDLFLTTIEHELSDAGYYLTSREENTCDEYMNAVYDDLKSCGFAVQKETEAEELCFDFIGCKRNDCFYCITVDNLERSDMLAYVDTAFDDITVNRLKRKGNAVVCFISDNPQDSAIALSKAITTFGKKEQIRIASAIVNPAEGRVYFLGNMQNKCQQLIVNHIMNCELPIKDKYIGNERLPFQDELEEKMKSFNAADYKNGTFYAH